MNKDMYLIRAVEMATIAAYKFIGRKDKNAVDFAAVEAMTIMLNSAPIKCRIINWWIYWYFKSWKIHDCQKECKNFQKSKNWSNFTNEWTLLTEILTKIYLQTNN